MSKGTYITCKSTVKKAEELLKARGLGEGGATQKEFTLLLAKYMDNYIPYDTGRLKNSSIKIGTDYIKYDIAYAKKQYYTNSGNSPRNRGGRRGKKWDKRAWSEKGSLIIKELNKFIGGTAK